MKLRIGVVSSHPIQYQAPLFRELAKDADLHVMFAHRLSASGQGDAGFGVAFEWDTDLLGGYDNQFLSNVARRPGVSHFFGCNTPEVAAVIAQKKFDAVIVMGWHLMTYWQTIRACRKSKVPILVRGDSQLGTPRSRLKTLVKEWVYPRLLRQFDACLYVGQRNREYLSHYGVDAQRLFFAPHCVDNDFFRARSEMLNRAELRRALGIASAELVVLFVGKLVEGKRPFDLIRAVETLRKRGLNVSCLVIGDGPLRADLVDAGRQFNVPLYFTGFRNQTQLPSTYPCGDLLVLPSGSETWGLVVNESLASGVPVVVSDAVGCAPDLALVGRTGAVFRVADIQSLAAAIEHVLAIPPSPEAIKAVIDQYSIQSASRGILNAVRSLQNRRDLTVVGP